MIEINLFTCLLFAIPAAMLFILHKTKRKSKMINENIMEKRLENFLPQPLVESKPYDDIPTPIEKQAPSAVFLDFASNNFLNIYNRTEQKADAEISIRTYGVGSCGPRGFYGTMDIHLDIESRIAQFMGLEETVLYSYGFSTIASAIPAYCRKSDIIFSDEEINFCARQGFTASRSKIVYFKHNDTNDLENQLEKCLFIEKKLKCQYRKFLVVEGIYKYTGQICPLPQLMSLREKYKLRIFLDESISIGVLGKTGRGVTEHFQVDRTNVDMIVGSLEYSLGSIGGFCVGASVVIEHQRLSGLGYCFSASLPPFLCQCAIRAIDVIQNEPEKLQRLAELSVYAHNAFSDVPGYSVMSAPLSPTKVLQVVLQSAEKLPYVLADIQRKAALKKLCFIVHEDARIALNLKITIGKEDVDNAAKVLAESR